MCCERVIERPEYRAFSAEAWVCVGTADTGCGGLGIGGVSPMSGVGMGGRTGREEGIMYSSSLSCPSSPPAGLAVAGDALQSDPRILFIKHH